MKNKIFLLLLIIIITITTATAALAAEYFVDLGEVIEVGEHEIVVKNVGRAAVLLEIDGEGKIINSGRTKSFDDIILHILVSYNTKEDSNITLSICDEDDEEICNNKDDDCDGKIDNDVKRKCGINMGICKLGKQYCVKGEWGYCEDAVYPQDEICNGLDDDCDGEVDEGISERVCGTDIGECERGVEKCIDREWVCKGAVEREKEICDGLDNDCDGMIDEADICTRENQTGNESLLLGEETEYDFSDLDLDVEAEDIVEGAKKSLWSRFWGFIRKIL